MDPDIQEGAVIFNGRDADYMIYKEKRKKHIIMKIAAYLILILLCACNACKKETARETEPNGSFSTSNSININSSINGLFNTRDDQDFYRLEIIQAQVLDIELSPVKGVNHAFKIWKGADNPVLVKFVDDNRKSSGERMCNFFFETGTYFISVQHGERDVPQANTENYYKLKVSARDWLDEEKEPNDTLETANLIDTGKEIIGYFSPSYNRLNNQGEFALREEDWFSFSIQLTDEKPVVLDVVLTGVPDVNSVLYLFNSAREQIGFSDANGVDEGETLKDTGITSSGSYFLMAASKNFTSNNEVNYKLSLNIREYDYTFEMEPNNEPRKANLIMDKEINGRIYPDGDKDCYYYKNNQGKTLYRIESQPPEKLDILITVFNKDMIKLFTIDNGGAGEREIMPDASIEGDFYIVVSARRGFFEKENPYKLQMSRLDNPEDYEIEPNDTKETATKITRNMIKGFISKKKDKDYYYLEYNKRVKKTFNITGIKNSELRVSITDPFGYIIKSEDVKDEKTVKFSEMIDQRGYVLIESLLENYDGPYILEIQEDK